ncbi:DUF1456 family protein [Arenibacter sp. GZD96]|uniref:DUF1456 family protein n=1 Tax=Aurantibrevibacter litoralis TaxID=3106030 RepID=UPI002AFF75A7|nr:DUF1456 family protein [Arenibacter sp. GZD-96]MEA1787104.1 DUF1456 family protein [Arenibacter sp. GZD-96]
MTNNDVLKKLRVALMLRDDHIVEILSLVDFKITKSELGAFFRSEDHPHYVACGDQILRNFLNGLVIYYRGTKEQPKDPKKTLPPPRKKEAEKKPYHVDFKAKQERNIDPVLRGIKFKNKKKS